MYPRCSAAPSTPAAMRKLVIRIATDNLTWAAGACQESSSAARYRTRELNEAYYPSGDHALGNVATPGGMKWPRRAA